ncbi:lytic transglycosylase domain-containing protein [Thiohalorhabdus methylotrophus]|uniref:Lytic transglycosylase domain-containing protein n=1 Tax=Thiohalorhabdus methylotrophus TaxID=3242694 RepID=A0ABV4TUV4_9GAMM
MSRWLLGLAMGLLITTAPPATAGPVDPRLRQELGAALDQPHPAEDRFARQVWRKDYMRRLRPFVDDSERRRRLTGLIFREARRADIPPGLVFAVIHVESAFKRFALSSAGARGLMQVMPFWREEIGRPRDNLFQPRTNLRYGCTILRHYLRREGGDILKALAAYNGSSGRTIYPEKIYRAYRRRWAEH